MSAISWDTFFADPGTTNGTSVEVFNVPPGLLIRGGGEGSVFPRRAGGHLTAGHVGKLIARALPGDWTAHNLRHRFATRSYRGSHNIRAVQKLLGHETVLSTERYTAVHGDEIRAAAACAW